MQTEIKIYNITDLIKKTVVGELDLEASLRVARDTAHIASLNKNSSILLDLRNTTVHLPGGFQDTMKIALEFTMNLLETNNRFAALIPDDGQRLLVANQLKACLQVKGIRYEIFTEFEKAMEWLSDSKTVVSARQ